MKISNGEFFPNYGMTNFACIWLITYLHKSHMYTHILHIHSWTHSHITIRHVHTHTYIYTHSHMYVYILKHMCTHSHTFMYTHVHLYAPHVTHVYPCILKIYGCQFHNHTYPGMPVNLMGTPGHCRKILLLGWLMPCRRTGHNFAWMMVWLPMHWLLLNWDITSLYLDFQ